MANYGYIHLHKGIFQDDFKDLLKVTVMEVLGPKWEVKNATFTYDGPTLLVMIPGTAVRSEREANKRVLAPGEDVGFTVSIMGDKLAFRHGPNSFERWAQGCVEEQLADYYQIGVYYDAVDEVVPPNTYRYRTREGVCTYRDYVMQAFPDVSKAPVELIERYRSFTPAGHW